MGALYADFPNNAWYEIYQVYKPRVRLKGERFAPEWRVGNLVPVWDCEVYCELNFRGFRIEEHLPSRNLTLVD